MKQGGLMYKMKKIIFITLAIILITSGIANAYQLIDPEQFIEYTPAQIRNALNNNIYYLGGNLTDQLEMNFGINYIELYYADNTIYVVNIVRPFTATLSLDVINYCLNHYSQSICVSQLVNRDTEITYPITYGNEVRNMTVYPINKQVKDEVTRSYQSILHSQGEVRTYLERKDNIINWLSLFVPELPNI